MIRQRFEIDHETVPRQTRNNPNMTPTYFQNVTKTIPTRFETVPRLTRNDPNLTPTNFQNVAKTILEMMPTCFPNDPTTV